MLLRDRSLFITWGGVTAKRTTIYLILPLMVILVKYPLIAIDKFCNPPQCLSTHIHLSTFIFSAFNGHMKVISLTLMLTYRLMKPPWCKFLIGFLPDI